MDSDRALRANRWGVLGIIMMGTFMAILDSSIVNVALPHMMASFGVDREQIEWVSTGFMMASAVVMPLPATADGVWRSPSPRRAAAPPAASASRS